MNLYSNSDEQKFNLEKFKIIERKLDDVMELIDMDIIKNKLVQVEKEFENEPNEINKARLGIIYHEVALNLSFFSKTNIKVMRKKVLTS